MEILKHFSKVLDLLLKTQSIFWHKWANLAIFWQSLRLEPQNKLSKPISNTYDLGPLHTRAKSRDHEIMRAQKIVSRGLSVVLLSNSLSSFYLYTWFQDPKNTHNCVQMRV